MSFEMNGWWLDHGITVSSNDLEGLIMGLGS